MCHLSALVAGEIITGEGGGKKLKLFCLYAQKS